MFNAREYRRSRTVVHEEEARVGAQHHLSFAVALLRLLRAEPAVSVQFHGRCAPGTHL